MVYGNILWYIIEKFIKKLVKKSKAEKTQT